MLRRCLARIPRRDRNASAKQGRPPLQRDDRALMIKTGTLVLSRADGFLRPVVVLAADVRLLMKDDLCRFERLADWLLVLINAQIVVHICVLDRDGLKWRGCLLLQLSCVAEACGLGHVGWLRACIVSGGALGDDLLIVDPDGSQVL